MDRQLIQHPNMSRIYSTRPSHFVTSALVLTFAHHVRQVALTSHSAARRPHSSSGTLSNGDIINLFNRVVVYASFFPFVTSYIATPTPCLSSPAALLYSNVPLSAVLHSRVLLPIFSCSS